MICVRTFVRDAVQAHTFRGGGGLSGGGRLSGGGGLSGGLRGCFRGRGRPSGRAVAVVPVAGASAGAAGDGSEARALEALQTCASEGRGRATGGMAVAMEGGREGVAVDGDY